METGDGCGWFIPLAQVSKVSQAWGEASFPLMLRVANREYSLPLQGVGDVTLFSLRPSLVND